MSEALPTSDPRTSPATGACITSPASADGPTPSSLPAGHESGLFGPVPVPASRLARQAREKARRTKDTSGPCSFGSSASAALQRSLANRLLQTTDTDGSPEYVMTWKRRAMPSGAPICRLAARARPSSANAFGGWPAPDHHRRGDTNDPESIMRRLAASKKGGAEKRQLNLQEAVQLVGWNAPRATDGEKGGPNQSGGALPADAALAGWTAPAASDGERSGTMTPNMSGSSLTQQSTLAGWAAPAATDGSKAPPDHYGRSLTLVGQVLASGPPSTSLSAATSTNTDAKKRGVLNPEHSRWLQGYPVAWGCCGVTAIASCRKSRRSSSARSSKRKQK